MRKNILTGLGIAALLVGQTYAQALTEHATITAAGAGSLTGSAAGKKVSDLLTRAAKGDEASETAQKPAPEPKGRRELVETPDGKVEYQTVVTPAQMPPAAMPAPSNPTPRASRSRSQRGNSFGEPVIPSAYALTPVSAYSYSFAPPPPAHTELLPSLAVGASRSELQSTIGVPTSRVTIPGGGLTEIYFYQERDTMVGTVRVVDGAVAQVDVY